MQAVTAFTPVPDTMRIIERREHAGSYRPKDGKPLRKFLSPPRIAVNF